MLTIGALPRGSAHGQTQLEQEYEANRDENSRLRQIVEELQDELEEAKTKGGVSAPRSDLCQPTLSVRSCPGSPTLSGNLTIAFDSLQNVC